MELFTDKADCCGCGLCVAVCPHKAISFQEDAEGFAYPAIDQTRCTDCGLCKTVCSFQRLPEPYMAHDCYAARHTDAAVLQGSSSGGVFTALAAHTLAQGGAVFGAVFDEHYAVRHTVAESPEALAPMRGSKYLPSDMSGVYAALESALRVGRHVLFTGTPCQVAAVHRFAQTRKLPHRERLTTMDLLCHGFASPVLWRDYLADVTARFGAPGSVSFRSKDKGWSHRGMKLTLPGGRNISEEVNRRADFSPYGASQCMNRPSCHKCPFACSERMGDFTAGDFVGIEMLDYAHPPEEGVSVLLVSSDAARAQLSQLPLQLMPVTPQQCMQPSLAYAAAPPRDRERFWSLYRADGFAGVVRRYGHYTLEKRIVYKIIVPICKKLGIYQLAARLYLKRGNREAKP